MNRTTCDGCLEDIEPGDGWFGMDEYLPYDADDEEDSDPVSDVDYGLHFHRHDDARCVWAWALARMADQTEDT